MKKDMEMNFRLEWSEKTQHWHYDNFTHAPNTYGWVTISECEPDSKLRRFTFTVDSLGIKKLTTKQVRILWSLFNHEIGWN